MIRIGIGYDVHAFAPERPLILGGVRIPHHVGLAGHSDADVLTHAIADALLGAVALGDIGLHFPDSDPDFAGADSILLLHRVVAMLREHAYRIQNVDATVVLQEPRLRPHIDAMRRRLSDAMGVAIEQVSVKATTTEQLGFVGRREGVAAHAICAVQRDEHR